MKLISLKCPECGAPLNVEDRNREFYCCQCCQAKVMIYDENEKVIRDADVEILLQPDKDELVYVNKIESTEKECKVVLKNTNADEKEDEGAEMRVKISNTNNANTEPSKESVKNHEPSKESFIKNVIRKFKNFWGKNSRNKVIIAAVASVVIVCFVGAISTLRLDEKEVEWPSNNIVKLIPKPDGKVIETSVNEKSFSATVIMNKEQYSDYVSKCKKKGFKNISSESKDGDYYYFHATNAKETSLSLSYDVVEEELDLSLNLNYNTEEDESETAEDSGAEASSGTVNADFKATMDSYESFVNEYVTFIKKYENSSDASAMLQDYSAYMSKYADLSSKIDSIDENSLSSADYKYYTEVMARVSKKLAEIGE